MARLHRGGGAGGARVSRPRGHRGQGLRPDSRGGPRRSQARGLPRGLCSGFPHRIYLDRPQANERHFVELVREAVEVPGPATEALGRAARDASAYVGIGVNERSRRSAGELFNTIGMEIAGPETWPLLGELRRRAGSASSEELPALVESLLASLPAGLT